MFTNQPIYRRNKDLVSLETHQSSRDKLERWSINWKEYHKVLQIEDMSDYQNKNAGERWHSNEEEIIINGKKSQ